MAEIRIPSSGKIPNLFRPIDLLEIGNPGMPGELIIHNGALYIYGENGETLIEGGKIQTGAILAGSITTGKLSVGSQSFVHDITWTATDEDTCSWSSGTLELANGESISINSGDTGNITDTTYIYYNGSSTLATTTTNSNAIGDTKLLMAIVEKSSSGGKCIISPIYSGGTTITGNQIVTGKIESEDGKTYFDLNNNRIIVNDGTTNRILIGKR